MGGQRANAAPKIGKTGRWMQRVIVYWSTLSEMLLLKRGLWKKIKDVSWVSVKRWDSRNMDEGRKHKGDNLQSMKMVTLKEGKEYFSGHLGFLWLMNQLIGGKKVKMKGNKHGFLVPFIPLCGSIFHPISFSLSLKNFLS